MLSRTQDESKEGHDDDQESEEDEGKENQGGGDGGREIGWTGASTGTTLTIPTMIEPPTRSNKTRSTTPTKENNKVAMMMMTFFLVSPRKRWIHGIAV